MLTVLSTMEKSANNTRPQQGPASPKKANQPKRKAAGGKVKGKGGKSRSKKKSPAKGKLLSVKTIVWIILLAVSVAALFFGAKKLFSRIDTGHYKLPEADVIGIDISHYQGRIKWDEMRFNYDILTRELKHDGTGKRDIDFIIAKATEGVTTADTHYRSFRGQAKRHGYTFGAYHYFKPNLSPARQAANFIKVAALLPGDILPILDVEEQGKLSATELQDAVLEWLQAVEKEYECAPILYCNLKYYSQYFTSSKFRKYPIWIASYSRNPVYVNYVLWQQTDSGIVGGINQKVDINVFNGKKKEFKTLLIP